MLTRAIRNSLGNKSKKEDNLFWNKIRVPLVRISREGYMLSYNQAFAELLNIPPEVLAGLNFFDNPYRILDSVNQESLAHKRGQDVTIESYWRRGDSCFLYVKELFTVDEDEGY